MVLNIEMTTSKHVKERLLSCINDTKPTNEVLRMPGRIKHWSTPPPPTCSDTAGCQQRPPAVDKLRPRPFRKP